MSLAGFLISKSLLWQPKSARAAVSLTNNLAEGHGRHHYLDQLQFLLHARGSLEELIDELNVCLDEKYLPITDAEALKEKGLAGAQSDQRLRPLFT
jgi:four helix bundle protein